MTKLDKVSKHYSLLSPEERFQLIVAAAGRNDDIERTQLVQTCGWVSLSFQDHAPYAHAFNEVANWVYLDLLEEAQLYLDSLDRVRPSADLGSDADADTESGDQVVDGVSPSEDAPSLGEERSIEDRVFSIALAAGFVVKAKWQGWELFCDRLKLPAKILWSLLPGFKRLESALAMAEVVAFTPAGFLRWNNELRPSGTAERTDAPYDVDEIACGLENLFRQQVGWWRGER